MITRDFHTPSRMHISDTNSPNYDFMQQQPPYEDPQSMFQTSQGSGKRRSQHPLSVNSSKFSIKTSAPPFFQDSLGSIESTDVTHSCVMSESITGTSRLPIIEHLDLNSFKIKSCSLNTQHNHKHCPYYHNAKDRKRLGFAFSAELCEYAEKDGMTCPHGEMCPKAHNRVEQLYRPEKYKTKFCTFYPHNLEKCDYGTFCSFAHNENDISIELIHNYEYDEDFYMFHFKTVWCPFNLTQHDKALCVYAHNWQDYRRKPNVCAYDPTPCQNWRSTDFILNYEDGCYFKEKCSKCHGWKENEYHPLNYKSKPCPAGKNCNKGRDCPHFHSLRERRVVSPNIANRVFRYVPRNRIITNTFKFRSEEKQGYAMPIQTQNMNPATMSTYPSLTFSQEGDSAGFEQFPSLSGQFNGGNIPLAKNINLQETFNQDFTGGGNSAGLNREMERNYEMNKQRTQSFDFEPTGMSRPRINSSHMASTLSKPESALFQGLRDKGSTNPASTAKARRWSTHDEVEQHQENDKLFREIFMAAMKKESSKAEEPASPSGNMKVPEDKAAAAEQDMKNNQMLDQILENDDM